MGVDKGLFVSEQHVFMGHGDHVIVEGSRRDGDLALRDERMIGGGKAVATGDGRAGRAVLAGVAVAGLPLAKRLVPPLPHLREAAVLGLLGLAGAVAYAGTLLAVLAALGVRLRRA